jgi:hypothetical protein
VEVPGASGDTKPKLIILSSTWGEIAIRTGRDQIWQVEASGQIRADQGRSGQIGADQGRLALPKPSSECHTHTVSMRALSS